MRGEIKAAISQQLASAAGRGEGWRCQIFSQLGTEVQIKFHPAQGCKTIEKHSLCIWFLSDLEL